MKTSKLLTLMLLGTALSVAPVMAQRGGGGHSSMSSSRSSSSSMSSSRSSSSMSSSRSSSMSSSRSSMSSSPSRSSSSMSSSRSSMSSSPSRSFSTSPSRSASSYTAPSHSKSSSSFSAPERSSTPSATRGSRTDHGVRSAAPSGAVYSRGGDRDAGVRSASSSAPAGADRTRTYTPPSHRPGGSHYNPRAASASAPARPAVTGRPTDSYARPGRPGGVVPPADRPMRPAPYFHHPIHHHMVHCHPIYWAPVPPRPWYWPGFWGYCNSYWYDYHVTDVVVVRDYVKKTYSVDMLDYAMAGDLMYALVKDGGKVYLQIYDREDHLLAEQPVHRKYCKVAVDSENGGCWIMKKHDKDPLLFIYAEGELLIYEAD